MINNRKIKVAVVGGGASGWSAVKALKESEGAGIEFEITIYEKESRWGGKCRTIVPAKMNLGDTNNGSQNTDVNIDFRNYELGAGAISGDFEFPSENYRDVLNHLRELNIGLSLIEVKDRKNYLFFKNLW